MAGLASQALDASGCLAASVLAGHHLWLAVFLFVLAFGLALWPHYSSSKFSSFVPVSASGTTLLHSFLGLSLILVAQACFVFAHHSYAVPSYLYLSADYASVTAVFVHHLNIAGLLIIGGSAHVAVSVLRDLAVTSSLCAIIIIIVIIIIVVGFDLLAHRCLITGHLAFLVLFLGLHSFGILTHNDTLQALGRQSDLFSDNALQLKPVLALWLQSTRTVAYDIDTLGSRVVSMAQELGTADFITHHIHAFTTHITLLVVLKGCLYSRSSRLIFDKMILGFRFPCDGPGRGGSCQVSAQDHVFLALFWAHNSLSVVIFHSHWKLQSDVWGSIGQQSAVQHLTGGDFSI